MSERVILRILCSRQKKAHVVGTVVATNTGTVVRYTIVVDGVHGPQGHPEEIAVNTESSERAEAWCQICSKRLELGINDVVAAAKRGDKSMRLVAEGMWTDPIGVLDRRAVPPTV